MTETNNSNQIAGYLQSWSRIWTRDYREQIQQVARAGLEPGTAGLRVRRADHSATLPPWNRGKELYHEWLHFSQTSCQKCDRQWSKMIYCQSNSIFLAKKIIVLFIWLARIGVACENIRFSSLFADGDVSRGGTSATQRQKFHTDDVKSVQNPVRSADWSTE